MDALLIKYELKLCAVSGMAFQFYNFSSSFTSLTEAYKRYKGHMRHDVEVVSSNHTLPVFDK